MPPCGHRGACVRMWRALCMHAGSAARDALNELCMAAGRPLLDCGMEGLTGQVVATVKVQ